MAESKRKSLPKLYEISRHMVSTLDLDEVVNRVLTNSVRYVGAERGMLIVISEQRKPDLAAVFLDGRIIPSTSETVQQLVNDGLAGNVLQECKTILVKDTSRDPRWLSRPDDDPSRSGPKSAICAPVRLNGCKLVGILTLVHSKPGFLNDHHVDLVEAVTDQAALAIYNAQQYRRMEHSQLHYQQLYEDGIDPVLITDWTGIILESNRMAARVSGFLPHQLAGKNIADLHAVDWAALGENFSVLQSGQVMASYESDLRCREAGRLLPIQVYAQKIVFRNETCIQWLLRDITSQRELDTLRSELQAMVYHDLRSPLSNVVSSLDLIRDILPAEQLEELQPLVSIALRAIDRVKRLSDTLLDIQMIEAGQTLISKTDVRVQKLAAEALDTVQISAAARGHQLLNEIPAGLPAIQADDEMLQRVYINLLENAIKFVQPGGQIVLGGRLEGAMLRLWVEDNGPGIPPGDRERIFEKFTRSSAENTTRGLGLGLAFSRLAIQAHGGTIWVEASQPHGSRFVFCLPVG